MRVGLTGGIGAGKSTVARLFSDWGAMVIDADVLAREVVAPGSAGLARVAALWPQVIDAEGTLDRAALARVVFSDSSARDALTAIIHPLVRARAAEREREAPPESIVVHVVPLLFEGDYWRTCDATVVVTAPDSLRLARVGARDGLTVAEVRARMAAQIAPERARAMANFVIENDADPPTLERRARAVYEALAQTAASSAP